MTPRFELRIRRVSTETVARLVRTSVLPAVAMLCQDGTYTIELRADSPGELAKLVYEVCDPSRPDFVTEAEAVAWLHRNETNPNLIPGVLRRHPYGGGFDGNPKCGYVEHIDGVTTTCESTDPSASIHQ